MTEPQMAQLTSSRSLVETAQEHRRAGRLAQAEETCREVLRADGDNVAALRLMSRMLVDAGHMLLALPFMKRLSSLEPDNPVYHNALANAYLALGRFEAAQASAQQATLVAPDFAAAHATLAAIATLTGDGDAAVAGYRRAVMLDPASHQTHSSLVFGLHYTAATPAELLREAQAWAARHERMLVCGEAVHTNSPEPERRLRIGFVSADLGRHPVGYFLPAALSHRDEQRFETFCYSSSRHTDDLASCFRTAADQWRDIDALDDAQAAALIRRDRIDLLVDLSGHSHGNRLLLFARRPAPVQVTWLGYFGTTGMQSMDYLIAGSHVVPPGNEQWFTERVVRLPAPYLCYTPQTELDVAPSPVTTNGFITFGCFNKIVKVTDQVAQVWSDILRAVDGSRLCLKDRAFSAESVCRRVRMLFERHGVDAASLTLLPASPHSEYFAGYGGIDIALDPFPFNGGTTTVEGLWMGVPAVTLAGDHYPGRMGVTHLTAVGLSDLIARTTKEYVEKAVALALDPDRLADLRRDLRGRMRASPLCDAPRFARALEGAYREMWRSWCAVRTGQR
jgi:protein O-GlcNAc transferase